MNVPTWLGLVVSGCIGWCALVLLWIWAACKLAARADRAAATQHRLRIWQTTHRKEGP